MKFTQVDTGTAACPLCGALVLMQLVQVHGDWHLSMNQPERSLVESFRVRHLDQPRTDG